MSAVGQASGEPGRGRARRSQQGRRHGGYRGHAVEGRGRARGEGRGRASERASGGYSLRGCVRRAVARPSVWRWHAAFRGNVEILRLNPSDRQSETVERPPGRSCAYPVHDANHESGVDEMDESSVVSSSLAVLALSDNARTALERAPSAVNGYRCIAIPVADFLRAARRPLAASVVPAQGGARFNLRSPGGQSVGLSVCLSVCRRESTLAISVARREKGIIVAQSRGIAHASDAIFRQLNAGVIMRSQRERGSERERERERERGRVRGRERERERER